MITVDQAIAAYPELGRLHTVMTQPGPGWHFQPEVRKGGIYALRGRRMWPGLIVDQLGILSPTNAAACRRSPFGGFLWAAAGTLADVVDGYLELPPPDHTAAPVRPNLSIVPPSSPHGGQ